MTTVNQAKVEQTYLSTHENANGTSSITSAIAGQMVEGYDRVINSFSADLVATNTQKNEYMKDKNQLDSYLASMTCKIYYTDSEGKVTTENKSADSAYQPVEGYVTTNKDLKDEIVNKAKEAGVSLTVKKYTDGDKKVFYCISKESVEAIKDGFDQKIQDLNCTSELKMINFQGAMDSRKQALLMLSNIMSSDNQSKMAIVNNMKS